MSETRDSSAEMKLSFDLLGVRLVIHKFWIEKQHLLRKRFNGEASFEILVFLAEMFQLPYENIDTLGRYHMVLYIGETISSFK